MSEREFRDPELDAAVESQHFEQDDEGLLDRLGRPDDHYWEKAGQPAHAPGDPVRSDAAGDAVGKHRRQGAAQQLSAAAESCEGMRKKVK